MASFAPARTFAAMALHVLAALTLAWPASAQAQQAEPAAPSGRELYRLGAEAFDASRFDEAYEFFRRSYERDGFPQVLQAMGLCQLELGHPVQAVAHFEEAIASEGLSSDQEEAVAADLRAARSRLATLAFVGEGEARVGNERCPLPCEIAVDPGAVTYALGGAERVVTLNAGERREVVAVREVITQTVEAPAATSEPVRDDRRRPGRVLAAIGGSLAAVGVAGTVGFGLRARNLRDEWSVPENRSPDLSERGNQSRRITNASIGVAAVGGLVLVTGLILLARSPSDERVSDLRLRW
ncbi:MAG: hypothetical protein AAF411_19275 [Myxococcota bacterium]